TQPSLFFGIGTAKIKPFTHFAKHFFVEQGQGFSYLSALKIRGMDIEIWSIGKENEPFIEDGVQYYFKKTRPYNPVQLVTLQLPKKLATTDVELAKQREEELVLKKLQPHHYLVLLDERRKQLDSPQWARQFQQCMNNGVKT